MGVGLGLRRRGGASAGLVCRRMCIGGSVSLGLGLGSARVGGMGVGVGLGLVCMSGQALGVVLEMWSEEWVAMQRLVGFSGRRGGTGG